MKQIGKLLLGLSLIVLLTTYLTSYSDDNDSDSQNPIVGSHLGFGSPAAEVVDQLPFDEVHFQINFFADGSVKWTDAHNEKFAHGDGSGTWTQLGDNLYRMNVVLMNYDDRGPDGAGSGSFVTISWNGGLDSGGAMTGTLDRKIFPRGTDPTNFDNPGGLETFPTVFLDERGATGGLVRRTGFQPEPGESLVTVLDRASVPLAGAYFGKGFPRLGTVPADPVNGTPEVPEVVMMLNFYPDGTIGASDVLENLAGFKHASGHGAPWRVRDDGIVEGMFLWQNLAGDLTTVDLQNPDFPVLKATPDNAGYAKVRITGRFPDSTTINTITGTVRPRVVLPTSLGGDALATENEFPVLGSTADEENSFDIVDMTRIGDDSQSLTTIFPNQDYSSHPAAGVSWFGLATPVGVGHPDFIANPRYTELFITPTFGAFGNLWANDSQQSSELPADGRPVVGPHGNTFGNWIPSDDPANPNGLKATGMWIDSYTAEELAVDPAGRANNYRGATKVLFIAGVDADTGQLRGEVKLIHFPNDVATVPFLGDGPRFHSDPTNTGGIPLGTYAFDGLKPITAN